MLRGVKTHQEIDRRSLYLAETVVRKLEAGNIQGGIERARMVNRRWREKSASRLHQEWAILLSGDWPSIRTALLDESERGADLRQNNPFCGILTPQERWKILREYQSREAT
jgi:hypothetical protein